MIDEASTQWACPLPLLWKQSVIPKTPKAGHFVVLGPLISLHWVGMGAISHLSDSRELRRASCLEMESPRSKQRSEGCCSVVPLRGLTQHTHTLSPTHGKLRINLHRNVVYFSVHRIYLFVSFLVEKLSKEFEFVTTFSVLYTTKCMFSGEGQIWCELGRSLLPTITCYQLILESSCFICRDYFLILTVTCIMCCRHQTQNRVTFTK